MVDVVLAGYNVDAKVLEELKKNSSERKDVTPETISAAYARISRDPRSATELRQDAREEVERARKSNQTIVYKMGHHSIAEHAVFNFDVLNISRLAIEALEKQRLCSYTEKSQRYITLGEDYFIPSELAEIEPAATATFKHDFKTYREISPILQEYFHGSKQHRQLTEQMIDANEAMGVNIKDKQAFSNNQLDNWAKEDARYVLPLSTLGQLGFTTNTRSLEKFMRETAAHPLSEVRELGKKLFEPAYAVAPSLFLFTEPNEYHRNMGERIGDFIDKKIMPKYAESGEIPVFLGEGDVKLMPSADSLDNKVLTALIMNSTGEPYMSAYSKVLLMPMAQREAFMKEVFKGMNLWDDVPSEFEMADLNYDIVLSASAFAQFKRHRMLTLMSMGYDLGLGYTTPDSIKQSGLETIFKSTMAKNEELYHEISKHSPDAAAYALTNAHNRRILVKTNIRELYKISRLREDLHAQWDIRHKANKMSELARQVAPLSCMMLGGKHEFQKVRNDVYSGN